MVLDHVARRAGLLVEGAALLDADRLGHRDLHVVDVAAVPERLEDPVPEPEDHQVPDGLLAQVVIDPVDLRLAEDLADLAIEPLRRVEVAAERLLDDDPAPAAAVDLVIEAAPPELADDRAERPRAAWRGRRAGCRGCRASRSISSRRAARRSNAASSREVALVVDDPLEELAGHVRAPAGPDPTCSSDRRDLGPEGLVVVRPPADGDEHPVLGQEVRPPQLGQRRGRPSDATGRRSPPNRTMTCGSGTRSRRRPSRRGLPSTFGACAPLAAPLQPELAHRPGRGARRPRRGRAIYEVFTCDGHRTRCGARRGPSPRRSPPGGSGSASAGRS